MRNSIAPFVIMIGSDYREQGGIGSVLSTYHDHGFMDNKLYIISHHEGSVWARLIVYIKSLLMLLWHILTKPSIQIVHMHMSERGSFYRKALLQLISQFFGKKTILHFHGAEFLLFVEQSPPLAQRFIRYILNSTSRIFVLSKSWQKDLVSVTDNKNIQVVYNPVHFDETLIVDNKSKTLARPLKLLFLGRFGHRKGVFDLIQAVSALDKSLIELNLYGDGELAAVKKQIDELEMQNNVHVHGWIRGKSKHEALLNADVLILPSYNEGLPVAILEAMSYGLAVISTPVGGIAEAVHHNRNGLLVPPGDVQALTKAIKLLIEEPETLVAFQEESRNLCHFHFAHQHIFRLLNELYLPLIG